MKKTYLFVLAALLLMSIACTSLTFTTGSRETVEGSGRIVSENRQVSGFQSIVLRGSADIKVQFGEIESLQIEGDDNILPLIDTRVQRGELIISTEPNTAISPSQPILIEVTMLSLEKVTLSGSGSFDVPELAEDTFDIDLPGSGMIVAAGTVEEVNITLGGSGTIICTDLAAETARVRLNGSGTINVYASDTLDARINGSGTITYSGDPPNVSQDVSGSGSIQKQ